MPGLSQSIRVFHKLSQYENANFISAVALEMNKIKNSDASLDPHRLPAHATQRHYDIMMSYSKC